MHSSHDRSREWFTVVCLPVDSASAPSEQSRVNAGPWLCRVTNFGSGSDAAASRVLSWEKIRRNSPRVGAFHFSKAMIMSEVLESSIAFAPDGQQ